MVGRTDPSNSDNLERWWMGVCVFASVCVCARMRACGRDDIVFAIYDNTI